MARVHRWPNKRRNKYIRKVATQHAETLVNAIIKKQAQGDGRLGSGDISAKRTAMITQVAESIEQTIQKLRVRQ